MPPRIMYIECKSDSALAGPARIGRVTFSQTGKTLYYYYRGRQLQKMSRPGFKSNYVDLATGDEYWISGPKKRGGDRLYPGTIEIDPDVREEYWTAIRGLPQCAARTSIHCTGKYSQA
jgi:hypothetical protein